MTKKTAQWYVWYAKNKDKRDAYKKAYDRANHAQNPEKKRRAAAQWRLANPARAKAAYQSYYRANRAMMIQRATAYQAARPEQTSAKNARWARLHRPQLNFANRRNKKLRSGMTGTHSFAEWEALKARYNFKCLRCERSEPEVRLTQDHIVPVAKGGTNSIDNIQPLCKSCNSKKHLKTIDYRLKFA